MHPQQSPSMTPTLTTKSPRSLSHSSRASCLRSTRAPGPLTAGCIGRSRKPKNLRTWRLTVWLPVPMSARDRTAPITASKMLYSVKISAKTGVIDKYKCRPVACDVQRNAAYREPTYAPTPFPAPTLAIFALATPPQLSEFPR